ncbi:MAG: chorismate pyruvate-lyase family protein [Oscillospiraceae bacterium]|nr:chorismate pyruvate-lyase family protein [Oscillospiraceae bacterium]
MTEKKLIPNIVRDKINELEEKNNIKLSAIQKILCAIEGPAVTILDVLYGDVNLFILDQHIEKANEDIAEKLDINVGDEIDLREVVLHKHGRPLVYGLSYIPKDRCSNTVIEKLLKEDQTTGRILLEHEIETRTEVINITLEKPDAIIQNMFHTTEDMLTREYVLIHKKNIVIWSKELYPISYFKE